MKHWGAAHEIRHVGSGAVFQQIVQQFWRQFVQWDSKAQWRACERIFVSINRRSGGDQQPNDLHANIRLFSRLNFHHLIVDIVLVEHSQQSFAQNSLLVGIDLSRIVIG